MWGNSMKFSQSGRRMCSNAGELIGSCKPDIDYSLHMLQRLLVWVCILGIVLLASGVGNSGEKRCIFGHVFPERHAYYNSVLKRPSAYSILKLNRPPLWGPILRMETLSQSSVAGNMGESAQFDDKGMAFFYSAKLDGFDEFRLKGQLPACSWSGSLQVEFKEYAHGLDELGLKGQPPAFSAVSSFQAKFKEHAQALSSSRPAGGSGARNLDEERNESKGRENGRIGHDIGGIGGNGQRRDDGAPLRGSILGLQTLSQSSGAGNTGESARFDDKSIAFFYSAKLHGFDKLGLKGHPPAFSGVSSFQARFKERGQGQSSSRPAEGSGARNVDQQRTESRGGNSGRVNRGIGLRGGGQRRDNGDDDDNDRRMNGDVDNGRERRNPRLDEIVEIYLPIVIQTLIALLQIDDAQLSDTDRLIRRFAVVTNLQAFLCCLFVIRQPNMNQGNEIILGRMSRIASALSIMGFVPILAINLPLNLRWVVFLGFLAVVAMFWVDIRGVE